MELELEDYDVSILRATDQCSSGYTETIASTNDNLFTSELRYFCLLDASQLPSLPRCLKLYFLSVNCSLKLHNHSAVSIPPACSAESAS